MVFYIFSIYSSVLVSIEHYLSLYCKLSHIMFLSNDHRNFVKLLYSIYNCIFLKYAENALPSPHASFSTAFPFIKFGN